MRNKELTDMWCPGRINIVMMVFAVGTYALGSDSLVCADKATRPASPDTVDQIVLHQMGVRKIPGLTLVVVRGNTIVKRESYGVASAELCAPVTNRTKFGIGSISKQFTAAAIMLLAQDGKLKLDDSIAGFFPETGDRWKSVTIRQLLNHTAGIRDYLKDDPLYQPTVEFDRKQNVTAVEFVRQLSVQPATFAPGANFAYSNAGYVLLGLIVERVSSMKFQDFMRARIFEPLGLSDTGYLTPAEIIPDRAMGYLIDDGKLLPGFYVSDFYATQGDTSMFTTADDMAKWIVAIEGDRFIGTQMHQQMWTPGPLNDGTTTDYGFAWFLGDLRGQPLLEHLGAFITGYSAYLLYFPETGYSVFVAMNQNGASIVDLSFNIAAAMDPRIRPTRDLPPATLDPDPQRTARVLQFLTDLCSRPSTQVPITPGFSHELPFIHAVVGNHTPPSITFLACDDIRQSNLVRLGSKVTTECYYRAKLGQQEIPLSVWFSTDNKIADIWSFYY